MASKLITYKHTIKFGLNTYCLNKAKNITESKNPEDQLATFKPNVKIPVLLVEMMAINKRMSIEIKPLSFFEILTSKSE
tara:strand:- start:692 stop:928 length:237 start_codon:yes stop_codon:yes gene_type:complete